MTQTDTGPLRHEAAAVAETMTQARAVSAFCHRNPDADTIGAALAIALIAERLGKAAEVVSVDPAPPIFAMLPGFAAIRATPQLEPDVAVICDAATIDRIGVIGTDGERWMARARIVNIDHHVTNSLYGHVNYVDPDAAATCQLIAELLPILGVELDIDLASVLLTGIVRDSHGFSNGGTSGRTLRVAAQLVEAGAPIEAIQRMTLRELGVSTLALWGRLLTAMGQRLGGRIVYTCLTAEMLDETGTEQHDADGVAELLADSRGTQISILLRDLGRETRVSLRTSPGVDAAAIAASFGGGGHARRAGCTVLQPLAVAVDLVLAAAERALLAEPIPRGWAAPDPQPAVHGVSALDA